MNLAMKKLFFLLISILILNACGPANTGNRESSESVEPGWSPQNAPNTEMAVDGFTASKMANSRVAGTYDQETQKIITTANLNIEVKALEAFETAIKGLLEQYKAHITNQSRNDNDNRTDAYYTIRVPKENFDQLFNALKPLAKKVEFQSLNQQDVTEQFIDLETRLKNRKALEERYRELLKKATNVNDIMSIERQLNQVRSEIESQEGRLKYLNDQVDMSTIQLNAFELKPYVYQPESQDNFGQRVLKSLENGWHGLIKGLIWLVSLWPLWLLFIVLYIYFKSKRKAS